MAKALSLLKATQMGGTPEQARAYAQQNGLQVINDLPQVPTTPTQPQQSGGGNMVEGIGNLALSLIRPLTRLPVTAGYETYRAAKSGMGNKDIYSQESPQWLRDLGLLEGEGLSRGNVAKQTVKDVLSTLSFGVPLGKGASAFGKALPALGVGRGGMVSGALQGLGQENVTPGGVVGSSLTGGFLGKAGEKVGDLVSSLRGVERGAIKSVVNPKVTPNARAYSKELELIDWAKKKGLKGSADSMRKQVNEIYDDASKQINNVLKKENPIYKADDTLYEIVNNTVEGPNFSKVTKRHGAILEDELSQLSKSIKEGSITLQDINNYKLNLGGSKLSRAFSKLESGNPLTAEERVRMDLWSALDDFVTEKAPKTLKQLTRDQSFAHRLGPGLKESTGKTVATPIGRYGFLNPATQALRSKVGGGAGSTADLLESLGLGGELSKQVGGEVGAKALPEYLRGLTRPAPSTETDMGGGVIPTPGTPAQTLLGETGGGGMGMGQPSKKGQLSREDLILITLLGSPDMVKKATAVYELQQGGAGSADQQKKLGRLGDAEIALDNLEQEFSGISLSESMAGARLLGVQRRAGQLTGVGGDPNITSYEGLRTQVRSLLARTFGEVGNLTEAEQENAVALVPSIYDSKEEATRKLSRLRSIISDLKRESIQY